MHLRTLADTAAILAWHGSPPRPSSTDEVDAALRLYVVNSRLLHDSWAPLLLRSRPVDVQRSRSLIAEEVLTCELLSCSVAGYLKSAGSRLSHQQTLAEHIRQTNREYSERAVHQVTANAEVLSESLRIERLKRRLLQWGDRMLQPPCASHQGVGALLSHSTASISRSRHLRNWTSTALSLAVPNRVCTDSLRAGLMQEICGGALALLPETAYQSHGPLKPHGQRLVERHDDIRLPSAGLVSKRW